MVYRVIDVNSFAKYALKRMVIQTKEARAAVEMEIPLWVSLIS